MNETQLLEYGYEDNSSFEIKYEKCHIEIQSINGTFNQTLPCVNGYSYVPERSRSFVSEVTLLTFILSEAFNSKFRLQIAFILNIFFFKF